MSKILIIDDDADSRLILSAQLRIKGYKTVFAFDAVGAMAAAKREIPDLILLDLGLPGGDGMLVIERLRSLRSLAPIPIVVVSGRDPEVAKPKALTAGAAAFIAKPVNPKELLTIIDTHLHGKNEAEAKGQLRGKILIVEDDQVSRQVLNLQLQADGYQTAFAMDAVSATATVKRDPPDLIILDLGLPGGDGFTVLARLKAVPHLARIPVIVVSGRSAKANAMSAQEQGAVAYLEKPVNHEQLLAAVRQHLPSGEFRNNL